MSNSDGSDDVEEEMMMVVVGWRRRERRSQYGEVGQPSSPVSRVGKRLISMVIM